jgi:hypothetical protein
MPPGEQGPGGVWDLVAWPVMEANATSAEANNENRNLLIISFLLILEVTIQKLRHREHTINELATALASKERLV